MLAPPSCCAMTAIPDFWPQNALLTLTAIGLLQSSLPNSVAEPALQADNKPLEPPAYEAGTKTQEVG